MDDVATNRDLYRFIANLVKRRSENSITLDSYLENLRQLARAQRSRPALPLTEFAKLLETAFESPGPGPVAVLDASGAIITVDPRDIEEPVVEVSEITWRQFVEFLEAGQWYE